MPTNDSRAYRKFRTKLREAREQAGLTRERAARGLKRTVKYVEQAEEGNRRIDFVEVQRFARLYGRSIAFFAESNSRVKRKGKKRNTVYFLDAVA
jgi:transcriptional regulator with XRE-family HTH domain